jgi:hypothetical protein
MTAPESSALLPGWGAYDLLFENTKQLGGMRSREWVL